MSSLQTSYDDLLSYNPNIGKVLDRNTYDFLGSANKKTQTALMDMWKDHLSKNLSLLEKHGFINDGCKGFGNNKATIAIGAGPSLKRHTVLLRKLNHWNAQFDFKMQPFLFVCSNHQFKPYLDEGIIPHFVLLVDASESESVYRQLTNIPKRGNNVVLACSLYANPKITHAWDKRGGTIQFYAPLGDWIPEEIPGVEEKQVMQGGNVMNLAWTMSYGCLNSRVFMAVGNDLSYPISKSLEERRKGYYADGDYSSNLASRRDEAARQFKWMGFEMRTDPFTGKQRIDLKPRATVQSLYSYKNWLEVNIGIQEAHKRSFHYYNCSEEGVLGVIAKDKSNMEDKDNWILMDEVYPKHYHTVSFEDATAHFITMREIWRQKRVIPIGAENAILSPGGMVGARIIDQHLNGGTRSGIII